MKVLVTGATGFVGRKLVGALGAAHSVHGLTHRDSQAGLPGAEWHSADLSRPASEWRLPDRWDVLVHLAQSAGYREFPQRAFDMVAVNIDALVQLLELSRLRGARRVIMTSSANVYARSHDPIRETGALAPESFYARTKMAAELLCEPYASHCDVVVARMFTIYGPGQRPDMLIGSLIDKVRTGRAIQVQGRRGLLLSPVFVGDAVEALVRLVERPFTEPAFGVFNVAGPDGVDLPELAAHIGRAVGRDPSIEHSPDAEAGGWIGDSTAIRNRLGWLPATGLGAGLAATVSALGTG
jgi:UDP-glucose 4-epimerase